MNELLKIIFTFFLFKDCTFSPCSSPSPSPSSPLSSVHYYLFISFSSTYPYTHSPPISDSMGVFYYVIILVESQENRGHWTACLRYNDGTIEQFDSYGGKIDSEMKYISIVKKTQLGEENNELGDILKGYKVVVSKYKFQKLNDNIDTCGKWTLLRILMFVLGGMEIDQFTTWFKNLAKSQGCSNDELVCRLITF